jgi:hypothetical protein
VIVGIDAPDQAPSPQEHEWAKRAADLRFNALDRLRGRAEKWAGSITAITGAVGAVSLIKGRESIVDLTRPYEIGVTVLLAIAFLLSLRAILLAALAAQGSPAWIDESAAAVLAFFEQETVEAAEMISYSRVLATLAALVAAAAVGLTWLAPTADAPPPNRLVVTSRGTVLCGVLTLGDGRSATVGSNSTPVNEIVSVTNVAECPPK